MTIDSPLGGIPLVELENCIGILLCIDGPALSALAGRADAACADTGPAA